MKINVKVPPALSSYKQVPLPSCPECGGNGNRAEEHPHNGSTYYERCECWHYPPGTVKVMYPSTYYTENVVSVEDAVRRLAEHCIFIYRALCEAGVPEMEAAKVLPPVCVRETGGAAW